MKELQSPGIMHVFMREAINDTLETSSSYRKRAGVLLNSLVISDLISKQHLHTGYVVSSLCYICTLCPRSTQPLIIKFLKVF